MIVLPRALHPSPPMLSINKEWIAAFQNIYYNHFHPVHFYSTCWPLSQIRGTRGPGRTATCCDFTVDLSTAYPFSYTSLFSSHNTSRTPRNGHRLRLLCHHLLIHSLIKHWSWRQIPLFTSVLETATTPILWSRTVNKMPLFGRRSRSVSVSVSDCDVF